MSARSALTSASTTVATLALLTGCAYLTDPNHDALRPPDGLSTKTHAELLDETVQQTNDLVQLLGGEWLDLGLPPSAFDPTDVSAWRNPDPCDMNAVAEQYSIYISQVKPIEDPLAVIDRVRSHWMSRGYSVDQLGPTETSELVHVEIGVDLEHNGVLTFHANKKGMSIWISSECVAIEN
ncbi:hypothetical protein ACFQ9V_19700 [Leifsonia sp. NPDC056665]|uniref:hypothetical protein n=1 Tax=Leifsonia sp. NPDC056665 TaxID=3345901 RepID=UPI00369E560D